LGCGLCAKGIIFEIINSIGIRFHICFMVAVIIDIDIDIDI